jgi:protocatechuate 3,4-dioxygenase beta subunit
MDDGGLRMDRRRLLELIGCSLVAACSGDGERGGGGASNAVDPTGDTASPPPEETGTFDPADSGADPACAETPKEGIGPYPGDGSNGPDVLAIDGVVRSDIRTSLVGGATAEGIPFTLRLRLTDSGCAPLAGYAIYVWHCNRDGDYSMYSAAVADQDYLRGVQVCDGDGAVAFTTIWPGCYPGRWPHVHVEVYASVADATGDGEPLLITQIALPEDRCAEVYATPGYEASAPIFEGKSLENDRVFRDDVSLQLVAVTGALDALEGSLDIAIGAQ